MSQVYFFHGLESVPHGRKYHALCEHFDVEAPDFQGMHISERLEKAKTITEGMEDLVVVGSSYGGLLAALLYSAHPERFRGYVLAAPALAGPDADAIQRMPADAVVVHGTRDDVVPLAPVRDFCQRFDVSVIEVDDEHRLVGSMDLLIEKTRELLADD